MFCGGGAVLLFQPPDQDREQPHDDPQKHKHQKYDGHAEQGGKNTLGQRHLFHLFFESSFRGKIKKWRASEEALHPKAKDLKQLPK